MTSIPEPAMPPIRPKKTRNVFENAATAAREPGEDETKAVHPRPAATPKSAPVPAAARPERPSTKRMGGTKDILLSLPEELKTRMQATIAFTYPYTGIKHQQAFIREAIAQLCANLESKHNHGEPWPLPADLQDS
jgi:hypothetical protein